MLRPRLLLALLVLCCGLVTACQKAPKAPAVPLPDVRVGVVGAIQPMGTSDLLAGFIPEGRGLASPEALDAFNTELMALLGKESRRNFVFIPAGIGVDPTNTSVRDLSALRHWVAVGREKGVDLLIVPQILNWHERDGGKAGVVTPAEIDINFYLIDTRDGGNLLQRSHTRERQQGLANNLLEIDSFLKRGGRWLTAGELAHEAMLKMSREFGL